MTNGTESQELDLQLNEFYRDKYHFAMKCLSFLTISCALLSVIFAWMTYEQKQPSYYAAAVTGQVLPLHPLSVPIVTTDFIVQWSALTARSIYNLTFSNYQNQLSQVQNHFTPAGWTELQAALNSSGFITNLVNNRLIVSSVISGPPVILASMIVNGRFTWRVQMRLLVTYTSASAQTQRQMLVTMTIQRIPTLDSAQGIQVIGFNMTPVQ